MLELKLSEQMVSIIAAALGNHPYKEAAPVVFEIQKQIRNQMPQMPPPNGKDKQAEEAAK